MVLCGGRDPDTKCYATGAVGRGGGDTVSCPHTHRVACTVLDTRRRDSSESIPDTNDLRDYFPTSPRDPKKTEF